MSLPSSLRLHRWLGLTLGLWFALAGLSGSVLVFWHELEDAAWPESAAAPAGAGAEVKLEAVVAAALARYPKAVAERLLLPETAGAPMRVRLWVPASQTKAEHRTTVHVDPRTATVLGERAWGGAWIHVLYGLHSGLLLGEVAQTAVGLAGLVFAGLLLLGLVQWLRPFGWPWNQGGGRQGGTRQGGTPPLRGLRRLRHWHRVAGGIALLPLLVMGLTGAGLSFPDQLRGLAATVLPAPPKPVRRPPTGPINLAGAAAAAEAALPGWRVAWLELEPEDEPVALTLRPADARRLAGAGQAWVALDDGEVLEAAPTSAVETVRAWVMALHNGTAFGLAHRLFVVALGLFPSVLAATGWLAWRPRRRNLRAAAA